MISKRKIINLSISLKIYKYLKYLHCQRIVLSRYLLHYLKVKKKVKKIVFIGQVNSIHFKSFFEKFKKYSVKGDSYEFLLICSYPSYSLVQEKGMKVIDLANYYHPRQDDNFFNSWLDSLTFKARNILDQEYKNIRTTIEKFNPDILWIHDLQSGGYLIADWIGEYTEERSQLKTIVTTYGNDLFLFYDHPVHKLKINQVLKSMDFIQIETARDAFILENSEFSGEILPISSATYRNFTEINGKGDKCKSVKDIFLVVKGSTHMRSSLIYFFEHVKQNHSFFFEKKIIVYGATQEDVFFCEKLAYSYGVDIEFNRGASNNDFVKILERSVFSLNLNISDGVANALVEGVKAGCVPIFSKNSGVLELLDLEYHQYVEFNPYESNIGICNLLKLILDNNLTEIILNNFLVNIRQYFDDTKYESIFDNILK